jgi:hypothetical protein
MSDKREFTRVESNTRGFVEKFGEIVSVNVENISAAGISIEKMPGMSIGDYVTLGIMNLKEGQAELSVFQGRVVREGMDTFGVTIESSNFKSFMNLVSFLLKNSEDKEIIKLEIKHSQSHVSIS